MTVPPIVISRGVSHCHMVINCALSHFYPFFNVSRPLCTQRGLSHYRVHSLYKRHLPVTDTSVWSHGVRNSEVPPYMFEYFCHIPSPIRYYLVKRAFFQLCTQIYSATRIYIQPPNDSYGNRTCTHSVYQVIFPPLN